MADHTANMISNRDLQVVRAFPDDCFDVSVRLKEKHPLVLSLSSDAQNTEDLSNDAHHDTADLDAIAELEKMVAGIPAKNGGGSSSSSPVFPSDPAPLVEKILQHCLDSGIRSVFEYEMDHLCWRCATSKEYKFLTEVLRKQTKTATCLIESMIGGRPIATFKLQQPLKFSVELRKQQPPEDHGVANIWRRNEGEDAARYELGRGMRVPGGNPKLAAAVANDRSGAKPVVVRGDILVSVLEIPCPKRGPPQYVSGWEHAEFAVGAGTFEQFLKHQQVPLKGSLAEKMIRERKEKFGGEGDGADEDVVVGRQWDLRGAYKERNRDVAMEFEWDDEHGESRKGSVKFHAETLEEVISQEKRDGAVEEVPKDWFV